MTTKTENLKLVSFNQILSIWVLNKLKNGFSKKMGKTYDLFKSTSFKSLDFT